MAGESSDLVVAMRELAGAGHERAVDLRRRALTLEAARKAYLDAAPAPYDAVALAHFTVAFRMAWQLWNTCCPAPVA